MRYIDLNNVQEAGSSLPVGGYICKITSIADFSDKEYLKIEYDIAHGQYAGYYLQLWQNRQFWGGNFIKSYKELALPFFKGFITAVENSNQGFNFDGKNEQSLKGKYVGLVLGEEEYKSNSGEVKKRLYVAEVRSVQNIKDGKYNVPELKKLNVAVSNNNFNAQTPNDFYAVSESVDDEELPF